MSPIPVFAPDAQERVAAVVAEIEAKSSAELVVRLRERSGHYRHTDYLVGLAFGMASLVVFLFYPARFPLRPYPIVFALVFGAGALLSGWFPALQRALTSRALLLENVRTAARAAFVDDGVSRTRGRTGILVYVSVFERRVELVHDVGVDEGALGEAYAAARRALEGVLAESLEVGGFEAALRRLGPPLAAALPRAEDDVNELEDGVRS